MAQANTPQEREGLDDSLPGPQITQATWDLISTAIHNYASGWLRQETSDRISVRTLQAHKPTSKLYISTVLFRGSTICQHIRMHRSISSIPPTMISSFWSLIIWRKIENKTEMSRCECEKWKKGVDASTIQKGVRWTFGRWKQCQIFSLHLTAFDPDRIKGKVMERRHFKGLTLQKCNDSFQVPHRMAQNRACDWVWSIGFWWLWKWTNKGTLKPFVLLEILQYIRIQRHGKWTHISRARGPWTPT